MRALGRRVARLEKAARSTGTCACGGPWRVAIIIEGDDPEPKPCPKCGTVGKVIVLVRGEPPDADPAGFA